VTRPEPGAAYDRLSRLYDLLSAGFENRLKDLALHKLDARGGESVLEVGFGTGYALVRLARTVGDTGRVCGIDLSAGMLREARRKVGRAGLSGRVRLVQADARQLPFEPGVFDALFTSFTLELFQPGDMALVLSECRRVLRPRGRLAAVSLSSQGPASTMLRLYEWSHRHFPNIVDCRPIALAETLRAAGFTVTDAEVRVRLGLPAEVVAASKAASP
jgi:demethylmenaquinone methyltransferase/2-methoxy-6-polyprenyl-1,4-benzoquinol methylase